MKIIKLQIAILIFMAFLSSCNISNNKKRILSLKTEIDTSAISFRYATLDSAAIISKETGKPIFIYFTADGCGPCLIMDRSVFTDSSVMSFFNSNFVNVKSHRKRLSNSGIVTDEEKKLNAPIDLVMDKYFISGNPSFVIIDSKLNLIHKSIGYKSQKDLIQFGKDALSNDRNYAAIKSKIKNGDYSFETVKLYLEGTPPSRSLLDKIFRNTDQKVIDNYFKTQNKSDWSSKNNWFIIDNYINDFDSEQIQYLLHNQEHFYQDNDRVKVDTKTYQLLSNYVFNGGNIDDLKCPISDLIVKRGILTSKAYNDLNLYAKDFNEIYTKYSFIFDYEINNKSWEIYEESQKNDSEIDHKTIEMATNWMKLVTSYNIGNNNYLDTYEKLKSQLINN